MGADIFKGVMVWTNTNRSLELRSALGESNIPYVLADEGNTLFSQYCQLVRAESEASRVFDNIWVAVVAMVGEFPVGGQAFAVMKRLGYARDLTFLRLPVLWERDESTVRIEHEIKACGAEPINDFVNVLPKLSDYLRK